MNKQTLKIVVLSVISTLAVVALVAVISIPRVIDHVKTSATSNYLDEYEELAFILDESKDPVIQPNYIITGLIMSPDFQEYLDQGVVNGWWTEEFLEEFLIDEALPIFFTNYHVLFSVILGSEPVQNAGEQVTIIKAKVQQILYAVKAQVGKISSLLNSPAINNVKSLVASLEANKEQLIAVIDTLRGLDVEHINDVVANLKVALNQLEDVITAIQNLDIEAITSNVNSLIDSLTSIIDAINEIDTDSINEAIESLKAIRDQLQDIDKEQLASDIEKLKAIVQSVQETDFTELKALISKLLDLAAKIENGEFEGALGDLLESILNSDTIQNILDNLQLTVENILKVLNIYFTKFVDYDDDHNFFVTDLNGDGSISGSKEEIAVELEPYARLLNVIEIDIPEDGYTYDKGAKPASPADDTLVITTINAGFEIDGEAKTNMLSTPITVTGKNAFILNNAIGAINDLI